MPELTQLYVKTALAYLVLGLLLGVVLVWPVESTAAYWQGLLWPAWIHLLTIGWLTQLIFGVAIWLFPRYSRERPYGPQILARIAYPLLNGGLLLRLVSEPAATQSATPLWRILLTCAALMQWFAGALMIGYLWIRVKSR